MEKYSAHFVDKRLFLSEVEVLCNDLLRGKKMSKAQKINEEVKLLTSIGKIMSIGTP